MKVDIIIPENINEITVEQFQKYNKLISTNEPSEFVNQKTIEIFCNLDLKDVVKISYNSSREILNHLNEIFKQAPKFQNKFKANGITFGFEPNLEEITTGAYIDAETYLGDIDTLHKAMAVLYRPIKTELKDLYTIEDYNSSKDFEHIMKQAPLNVALGMQVFFCNLGSELLNAMSLYTHQMELSEAEKQHLERSGVGINQFTEQLKEMYSDFSKLLSYQYTNS